ncbi:P-loop containing nucleoside triphosphate hydrolase protein [Gorgonomyces haynaldii]|nr:P-loop containing nucleoside triphosphate hydrolase protein [Gorgonomyces haynaldii]
MPSLVEQVIAQTEDYLKTIQKRPIVIGISGPQGSGKTYLVQQLVKYFQQYCNTIGFSVDDLYLTRTELDALEKQPNPLLHSRGLPGTHDVALGTKILSHLTKRQPVEIPVFDKSLFEGKGDRNGFVSIQGPDIIFFEGWFLGFVPTNDLATRFQCPNTYLQKYRLQDLQAINDNLKQYQEWLSFVDAMLIIRTNDLNNILTWRWQQEQDLIQKRGNGMSKDQVQTFVQRFMPLYELYQAQFLPSTIFEIDIKRNVL